MHARPLAESRLGRNRAGPSAESANRKVRRETGRAQRGPFRFTRRAFRGAAGAAVGAYAKFASANDQFTRLFRKVSTNFGRRLR